VQCTPDLLPNDITGVSVFNQQAGSFDFRPGPVFVNILLADEINRATPRTQSALLEAMQEHQVTIGDQSYKLEEPFLVLATQNPIEYEGTFPLPEAQLDRFLMRLILGYPAEQEEHQILTNLQRRHPIEIIGQVVNAEDLLALQKDIWEINVDETVRDYIVRLVRSTRIHHDLSLGASPRASLGLFKAAQALAAIRGLDYVLPDHVKTLAPVILGHRLMIKAESALRGRNTATVLQSLLEETKLDIGELARA
jgi:MoxR-like ATPase